MNTYERKVKNLFASYEKIDEEIVNVIVDLKDIIDYVDLMLMRAERYSDKHLDPDKDIVTIKAMNNLMYAIKQVLRDQMDISEIEKMFINDMQEIET